MTSRVSICQECDTTFDVPGQRGCVPKRCPPCSEDANRGALKAWRHANPDKYAAQRARWARMPNW